MRKEGKEEETEKEMGEECWQGRGEERTKTDK